jgi:hypothetical protein
MLRKPDVQPQHSTRPHVGSRPPADPVQTGRNTVDLNELVIHARDARWRTRSPTRPLCAPNTKSSADHCRPTWTATPPPDDDKPIELFRAISAAAPGSYGIMYCFDHDHIDEPWQRWVTRRGHVHLEQDTSLSPHIGLVEDSDNGR